MPEGPGIGTERLRETIHEPPSGSLLRMALTTALFAALGAVAALHAGGTANEVLGLKTEATRLQAEASDQWAFYQAKGIKSAVQESLRTTWLAAGKPVPPDIEKKITQYAADQKEIDKAARGREHERDEKSSEAGELMERHFILNGAH